MSLAGRSTLAALTAVVLTGGRFLLIVIIARRLSSAGFGQFVFALWLVEITQLLTSIGIAGLASRYLAEFQGDESKRIAFMRRWIPWAITLPIVSGLAVGFVSHFAGLTLSEDATIAMSAWAVANGWWAMQSAALTGQQQFRVLLAASMTATVVSIGGAWFLQLGEDPIRTLFVILAAAAVMACGFGLRANLSLAISRVRFGNTEIGWGGVRVYALNIWLTSLLWSLVWSRGELPLVRAQMGDQGVATYMAAMTIYVGVVQGIMLWVSGVAPHLAALWGRGQNEEAVRVARRLSDVQMLVSGCGGVVLALFGDRILALSFGRMYVNSAEILSVLVLGLVTLSASSQNYILQLATNSRFNRDASLAGVCILYAAAAAMIPSMGLNGAAFSRLLAMAGLFAISAVTIRRMLGAGVLSMRNATVTCSVVVIAASAAAYGDLGLWGRLTALLLSLALLAACLRTGLGVPVVLDLSKMLSSAWRAPLGPKNS